MHYLRFGISGRKISPPPDCEFGQSRNYAGLICNAYGERRNLYYANDISAPRIRPYQLTLRAVPRQHPLRGYPSNFIGTLRPERPAKKPKSRPQHALKIQACLLKVPRDSKLVYVRQDLHHSTLEGRLNGGMLL